MTMKTTDVRDMTIRPYIPSVEGLPGQRDGGEGTTALDQPVKQSAITQSPSGLVQDDMPDSTTLQPCDPMSAMNAGVKSNPDGVALGPRG